jgi:hypothetical protein
MQSGLEKMIQTTPPTANFGQYRTDGCPECFGDHESNLFLQLHQNELLVGYFAWCPDRNERFFASVEEVEEGRG